MYHPDANKKFNVRVGQITANPFALYTIAQSVRVIAVGPDMVVFIDSEGKEIIYTGCTIRIEES